MVESYFKIDIINKLFESIDKNSEFEFMFYNYNKIHMNYEKYLKILKYMTHIGKKENLISETTLDIDYRYDEKTTYRVTIIGLDTINNYISMMSNKKSHVIFNTLLKIYYETKTPFISFMKKTKDRENVVNVDEFTIRIRLASEEIGDKIESLKWEDANFITFRYKQRISLIIETDKIHKIKLDLTDVKMDSNLNNLNKNNSIYELELELNAEKPKKEYFNKMLEITELLLKIFQSSRTIITRTMEDNVIDEYQRIIGTKNKMTLDGRKPISLEIQHTTEFLPNKYAVTDKADGERHFLIIMNSETYLISQNLNVLSLGLSVKNEKYNGTILDGEYVFISDKNAYMYLVFDCLFNGKNDIRKNPKLMERLAEADDVIEHCYGELYKIKPYEGKFDMDKIMKYYDEDISNYMKSIKLSKIKPTIVRKYFIGASGGKDNEIFKYASLIYKKFLNSVYNLDGLVFHPLNQTYTTNTRESIFSEYKWKPPIKNSMDFYIEFIKSKDGTILNLYDNSIEDYAKNKPYKICRLFVGKRIGTDEIPVPFKEEEGFNVAHLFLNEGNARDLEGNILQDKTVVEFYYDNNPDLPEHFHWVPIRTRYDKTESVQKFKRQYGNNKEIADKIWRSIINPILMDDMEKLSDDKQYDKYMKILKGRIGHELIIEAMKERVYFQVRTTLAKPMRHFHNWIKSILLFTYCSPEYNKGKQLSVFDLGVGRGGDIEKYYHTKSKFVVGIDPDLNALTSPVDSALSRYNQQRKKLPNFPRMFFINADPSYPMELNIQKQILGTMTDINEKMFLQFFEPNKFTKFDRINCQFVIHYLFKNESTFDNLTKLIDMSLINGGYMIITTFDAELVDQQLKKDGKYTMFYTDNKGDKKILMDIIKKYEGSHVGLGKSIDVYNGLISEEGVYITEFLVDKKFLISQLNEKCNMELIDTDTFEHIMKINEPYLKEVSKYENNPKTRKMLSDIALYYDDTDQINKACYQLTNLYRFYVFRKRDDKKVFSNNKGSKIKGGGKFESDNFGGKYIEVLHRALVGGKIIPKMDLVDFLKEFKINDTEEDISKINKSIKIEHNTNGKIKHVLFGLNTIVLEKDEDENIEPKIFMKLKPTKKDKFIIVSKNDKIYSFLARKEDGTIFFDATDEDIKIEI
jgi:hypothetical protein